MNNFNCEADNFESLINRRGLYRVWVPVNYDGKGPLISIWIDPKVGSFESERHEEPVTISGVGEAVAEEIEDFAETICHVSLVRGSEHLRLEI